MKLLIVEDDLSLINGLSFAMKKQGYEADIARTCLEAEDTWADGKYDLVILDVSLPDGSGCREGNMEKIALSFSFVTIAAQAALLYSPSNKTVDLRAMQIFPQTASFRSSITPMS